MVSRPQVRYINPVWPLAVFGVLVVAVAVAVGLSQWDRGDSESGGNSSAALAPSYAPASLSAAEALKAEMAAHEAWTEAEFGPLIRTTVTADVVMTELAEHDNAISGILGESAVDATDDREAELAAALAQHDAAFPPYTPDR